MSILRGEGVHKPGMIALDIRTLFFVATLATVLSAAALAVLWRTHPTEPSGRYWAAGAALASTGFLLIWLRGIVPSFVSIALANALLAAGYGVLLLAVERFTGRALHPWPIAACVLVVFVTFLVFDRGSTDLNARIVIISAVTGAMALWCVRLLSVDVPPGMELTQGVMAVVFALQAVAFLLRGLLVLLDPGATGHLFDPSTVSAAVGVDVIISAFGLAFGATAMVTRRLHLHLDHLASHDPLTGLPNRHAVVEAAARETARSARLGYPLSVLLLDIDHFKPVNDTHGHDAGDAVLRAFAVAAASGLRRDDVLGRYGGEEFLALLPNADREAALAVGERIRAAVGAMTVDHAGRTITVTVSIGVAEVPPRGGVWNDIMRAADAALYEAKRGGRDRVAG